MFGFLNGIDRNEAMLGDMWGLRPLLSKYGTTLQIQETSEVLGNVTGGIKTGAAYEGLTTATLQIDTARAFGWDGGTFNASALQIHGRNLSQDNLGTLQTASGIEADRATRLWELWYQQKFLKDDRADIRIGQQSLDQEFMVSQNALYFVNTMFGWPMVPSANMPSGGPAYPLSTPGIRLRVRPTDSITILAGIYNGNPAAYGVADPQQNNPSGLNLSIRGKGLFISEIQYAYPSLGATLYPDQAEPLSRVYKLGVWVHGAKFDDERYDTNGIPLADPDLSNGVPRQHKNNYAIYAVADQVVWQQADEPERNISVFLRPMGTTFGDRNLIAFSLNAGLTFHEPIPTRDGDTFGIGMGYTRVTGGAAGSDQDTAYYSGSFTPIRSGETFIEVTYQYEVTPWLQLQPDFQYVFNPGAGVANPNNPNQRIKDIALFGLRTNIVF